MYELVLIEILTIVTIGAMDAKRRISLGFTDIQRMHGKIHASVDFFR